MIKHTRITIDIRKGKSQFCSSVSGRFVVDVDVICVLYILVLVLPEVAGVLWGVDVISVSVERSVTGRKVAGVLVDAACVL